MNKKYLYVGCVLMAIGISGCNIKKVEKESRSQVVREDYQRPDYTEYIVKKGKIEEEKSIEVIYNLENSKKLSFDLTGYNLDAVYVNIGQNVKAGELLASVKNKTLNEQINSVDNEIKELQLELEYIKNQDNYATQSDAKKENANKIKQIGEDIAIKKSYKDKYQKEYAKFEIRAPFNGIIKSVNDSDELKYHNFITPKNVIVEMEGGEKRFIGSIETTDELAEKIEVGLEIEVVVFSKRHSGIIVEINENEGLLYIEAKLTDDNIIFINNTEGKLMVKNKDAKEELFLSEKAVFFVNEKPKVYILNEKGIKEIKEIKIGKTINEEIIILEGLKEGDKVVR